MNFIGVGEDTALREDLLNASELLSFAADFTSGGLSINQRNESLFSLLFHIVLQIIKMRSCCVALCYVQIWFLQ